MIRPFFPLRRWAIQVFLKQRQWRTHAAYGPVRVSEILDLLSLSPSLSFPVPVADDGSIYGSARARGFACASSRGQANWLSFSPNLCPPAPPTIPLNRPSWLRDIMFLKYCRETNSPLHALRTFHAPVYFSFRLTITSCC